MSRLLLALAAALALSAQAQTFPSRPITVVVPFPPGGSSDIVMRLVAKHAQETLGQPLLVDNRAGGGGAVGAVTVKNANPDGHMLYMGHTGTHVVNVSLFAKLEYDPIRDFRPITTLFSFPSLLVVPAASTARTVSELVQLGRTKQGGLSFASQGIGTTGHLIAEMFKKESGAPMVHIPMRGAAAAVGEVVAGRVDFLFSSYISAGPFIRDGKLRMLGITGPTRSKVTPDVPTMSELGVRGVDIDQWFAVYAPAGTPDAVIRRLNEALVRALRMPDVVKTVTDQGAEVLGSSPEALEKRMTDEIPWIARVVKESGARAD